MDPRIDPRYLPLLDSAGITRIGDGRFRQDSLGQLDEFGEGAIRRSKAQWLSELDDEALAPVVGLSISTVHCRSQPAGNIINLNVVRPETEGPLPCAYYIHGGGMARNSCFDGLFRTWTRLIAHQGVAVVAVDFRNSIEPSSVPEVAPYPAGLDDCVSGLKWVYEHADDLGVDENRIVVVGESGGGNLTLATGMRLLRQGELRRIRGLYAACPFIAGRWPQGRFQSSIMNDRILIDAQGANESARAYGMQALIARDPLAWPSFATVDDVRGLVPTIITVNECDPLRDEGIDFYRLLLRAGVPARCRQLMGVVHMGELFTTFTPDISTDAAIDIARFCRQSGAFDPDSSEQDRM